ncbi:hypothetical protein ACIRBX_34125 [Kitasatospora sp. NPDC096147]|uniref:hypothetical protein n=1 Tax=Kitasatospora sp. NPDC096147 TaxID=3364093 RepID=UPI00380194E7
MHPDLATAEELLAAEDLPGTARELRRLADRLSAGELAPLVVRLAGLAEIDELYGAAAQLADDVDDPGALYDYGYACIEHGLSALAVPALREALAIVREPKRGLFGRPKAVDPQRVRKVLMELVAALEDGDRHGEAVEVLQDQAARPSGLDDWPEGYLLAFNALMGGRLELAREVFGRLAEPEQPWRPAADRIARSLARAAAAPPVDDQDLRGWHHVLTGGLLATLSPYGFEAGMTGRYAYLGDSFDNCRLGLDRLRVVLEATGRRVTLVGLLPDRGSRALGLAAAELFGLPAAPYRPGVAGALVVAYDLNACDQELVAALNERAPDEILYEHVTCWTDTPIVSADVCGLLAQTVVAPWEPGMGFDADGERIAPEPDRRTAEELAEAILAASGTPDEGDGGTPADSAEVLAAYAARVAGTWAQAEATRDRVRSAGPVRSSRFA